MNHKRFTNRWLLALVAGLSLASTGCSRQAFIVGSQVQAAAAPGGVMIPPKVDILLVEDDTGSMGTVFNQVASQLPTFLNNLQSRGWDYHFATIPLVTPRTFDQIAASQYDSNWGASWIPPFPGAVANAPGTVLPSLFRTPSSYTRFLSMADINSTTNGNEPGLDTILNALHNYAPGTNFIRNDAQLVIYVVGNGNDTSGVTACVRSDGYVDSCEKTGPIYQDANGKQHYKRWPDQADIICTAPNYAEASCAQVRTGTTSFNSRLNSLKALKPSANMLRFFSSVSTYDRNGSSSGTCLGGRSYAGDRYIAMASALGGTTTDVCSQSISTALDSISSTLAATRLDFETRYLFVGTEPNPATIVVTKYMGGSGSPITIPEDPVNGWTYVGYTTAYAIDFPANMNLTSGYGIELHGAARLKGLDTANVEYKQAGAENSASK